jgi:hypothetical protein
MADYYRFVTVSGNMILCEPLGGTAVDELLATGTGDYEVYTAEDLNGDQTAWMIVA